MEERGLPHNMSATASTTTVRITLRGTSGQLTASFRNPVRPELGRWIRPRVALRSMTTTYATRNISVAKANNILFYSKTVSGVTTQRSNTIPDGTYDVDALANAIRVLCAALGDTITDSSTTPPTTKSPIRLSADVVLNRVRVDLSPGYSLFLSQSPALAANLGYPATVLVNSSTTADALWIGTAVAALEPFNSLFVRCSLVASAYSSINGIADGAIASFEPSVVLGGRITYNAGVERDWFPILGEYIRDVAVSIIDENGAVVDFGGEVVVVTLVVRWEEPN